MSSICPKCKCDWDLHEFAVPAPYCPSKDEQIEHLRNLLEKEKQKKTTVVIESASPSFGMKLKALQEFDSDQWWVQELEELVENAAPDQKRAVAVVRNLLKQIKSLDAIDSEQALKDYVADEFVRMFFEFHGFYAREHSVSYYADLYKNGGVSIPADIKPVKDLNRIDWIEQMARKSRTGITFQFVKTPADEDEPASKGYRVMSFHNVGEVYETLRTAIDETRGWI